MAVFEYNIADHPELLALSEANKVLPDGLYRAHVTDSQFRTSGAEHEYLEFTFEIIGTEANAAGETGFAHKGRKIWENCNLNHPDEFPRKMAHLTIAGLLQHTGVLKMQDTRDLHGISVLIKVKAQKNDPNRNCLDSTPWAAGILPDPNLVVDQAVRQAIPQATPAYPAYPQQPQAAPQAPPTHPSLNHPSAYPAEGRGYPQQPQAAALPSPHAYPNGPAPASNPQTPQAAQGAVAGAYQMAAQYQPQAAPAGGNGQAVQVVGEDELPF